MLSVFENSVLAKVFGPKTHEVARTCRRLHNEELWDLYSLTKYCSADRRGM